MKTQIALLVLATASVTTFALLLANLASAEQSAANILTPFLSGAGSAAPTVVLAQAYRGVPRGNGLWRGVYRGSLGVNPDYGTYNTYGPFYDQTGDYDGSLSGYCDWNTLYPFCYDYSDNFYLNR